MKSILFVINTMGVGGGEKALLELFKYINPKEYEVSLYVLTGQGELLDQIPEQINILNKKVYPISVHNNSGRIRLCKTILKAMFCKGVLFKRAGYLLGNLLDMMKKGDIHKDKLLWKILSDGAEKLEKEFDFAIAFLEGGASYYVNSHVKAKKKAAFIHINYTLAGYNRKLDEECYLNFDHIFTVSENIKKVFLSVYPECSKYTTVFYNLIDREKVLRRSKEKGGFSDDYPGFRILTVSRLVAQKSLDVAIGTMKILKDTGKAFRWYVLGEGEMRKNLEAKIRRYGLEEDFLLLGTVDNPYPYYRQCDLYVHTASFEGKSIVIEEAQISGCAILTSEYEGVYEQIEDSVNGVICKPDAQELARGILDLAENPQKMAALRLASSLKKQVDNVEEVEKLMELLERTA